MRPIVAELISPAVPPSARRFLTEVGLPTEQVLGMRFAHDHPLLTTVRQERRQFLRVTEERSSTTFAIEVRSGHVFEFDLDSVKYTRFFNSDIAALVLFLGLLRTTLRLRDVPPHVLEDAIDGIRISLTTRDPAAMEGTAPWAQMLDDLESQIE